MTDVTMHTCPYCAGSGRSMTHYQGNFGGRWQVERCRLCDGRGEVTGLVVERVEAGDRMREDRKARGLSLSQEAARLGITPQELSRRENGRA